MPSGYRKLRYTITSPIEKHVTPESEQIKILTLSTEWDLAVNLSDGHVPSQYIV